MIEMMNMMDAKARKEVAFTLLVIILAVLSIKGLITISQCIGYASYMEAEGGTITEIDLRVSFDVSNWNALYGTAWSVGYTSEWMFNLSGNTTLTQANNEKHLLFMCFQGGIEHELYASMVPESSIDFESLEAATVAEYDAYMNISSSAFFSATNTFTQTADFQVGENTITAPATITMRYYEGNQTEFITGILKDSNGSLVLVTKVLTTPVEGYNNQRYNYQMLLPIQNADWQNYYIWSDPTDECPEGQGESEWEGWVYGNVTDTSGNPLEGVIVEIGGELDVSENATGFYNVTNVPEGSNVSIYAMKTGYRVYHNFINVTRGNGTAHNIVLVVDQPPNPPLTGIGPGIDEPGDQVTTGIGPGQTDQTKSADFDMPPVIQRPKKIEGTDYIISIAEINRKLRIGNFLQEKITLYSFKETSANVFFELEGNVTDLIKLDKESVIIAPRDSDYLTATIFGVGEIGLYNGSLEITGDFNASIPITIEILPRDQLPVEALLIDLELAKKNYYPGEKLRFKTDLKNLLTDQEYPVRLFFSIQDLEGENTLWTYETNVFLKTSFSLIKTAPLPTNAKPGDYVLRVTANYLGLNSGTSQIFRIDTPWYLVVIWGPIKVWHVVLLLILIAIGIYAWWDIKRRLESKKKFHLKVEQNELPKPGGRSIWVGKIAETDTKTYFNMEAFMTHCIDAGSTGSGKSVSAQVIVEEMLQKGVAVIAFDPTAQWTGMLRKCTDKMMLSLYSYFGMKPNEARAFNGNIRMITDPREIIDIRKYAKPGEIQVFACHKLEPKEMDIFVANSIRQIFRAGYGESRTLKILFVYDEVHRLLPKFGGSGEGFLQIERGCREFRKWGLGMLLISQVLSDFVGTIKANINTEIQMRTRDEGDLERIRVKYGEDVLRSLVKATVGSGMVENPQYNRGKPYFAAFRPLLHSVQRLSDSEIENYNEYNDQIDQLQFELETLEKEGIDVFDLKLELKLALDKVKTGAFNMVQIYLEGLMPRIEKHWKKLGKIAPRLEKRLISEAELEGEIAKAKQARLAYEEEQKKKGGAAGGAVGENKKEDIYRKDVNPEQILKLVNGMLVINMASLYDEIAAMKDEDYEQHVNLQKNDFADWVQNAVGDKEVADHLRVCADKKEMLDILQLRKDKKPIPKITEEQKKKFQEAQAVAEMAKEPKNGKGGEKAPGATGPPGAQKAPAKSASVTGQTTPTAPAQMPSAQAAAPTAAAPKAAEAPKPAAPPAPSSHQAEQKKDEKGGEIGDASQSLEDEMNALIKEVMEEDKGGATP
ncbi:DUF87 domain-containing protein [Candidatus Woesearchaeota archaeon]|nr:DUF87 domain-containing protein [Candidatus Woesearchaeota archaeon]